MHSVGFAEKETIIRRHNCVKDRLVRLACPQILQGVLERRESGIAGMSALDWLFKLHLIAKKNDVLRASSHGNGIGQGHLTRFINEEEVEHALPFRQGEKPRGSAYDTIRVGSARVFIAFDVPKHGVIRKQRSFFLAARFDSLEDVARFPSGITALNEQVDNGLMTVGCDSDSLARR
jgi:hypothetical protein